jgi:hypothetical protein
MHTYFAVKATLLILRCGASDDNTFAHPVFNVNLVITFHKRGAFDVRLTKVLNLKMVCEVLDTETSCETKTGCEEPLQQRPHPFPRAPSHAVHICITCEIGAWGQGD